MRRPRVRIIFIFVWVTRIVFSLSPSLSLMNLTGRSPFLLYLYLSLYLSLYSTLMPSPPLFLSLSRSLSSSLPLPHYLVSLYSLYAGGAEKWGLYLYIDHVNMGPTCYLPPSLSLFLILFFCRSHILSLCLSLALIFSLLLSRR